MTDNSFLKRTVLTTADEQQWLSVLARLEQKDPHYLPYYLQIYENVDNEQSLQHFGGEGMLFVYGDSRDFIIYPFFKRSLANLPFSVPDTRNLFDIVSPYGYGGPLAQIQNSARYAELWSGFYASFDKFCQDNNIVSEFCRLNPIFENHKPVVEFSHGVVQQAGQIVYVDLRHSEEEIFAGLSKHRRRHVRRALEIPGLAFSFDKEAAALQSFWRLYTETMQRVGAHKQYFFPKDFFDKAFRTMGDHIGFCRVTHAGEITSVLLTISYGELVYAWLSGSDEEHGRDHSTATLMYKSIIEAKRTGASRYILGGGIGGRKSLFEYKAAFSNLTKDFYVYKRIHLKEQYDRLVNLLGYGEKTQNEFFPQYRLNEAVAYK